MLRTTPDLIVDIRNNGGGSDESYAKLLPLLYTNPMTRINSDIWSTDDNIRKFEAVAADTHYSSETREEMKALTGKLRQHIGEFVSSGDDDTVRMTPTEGAPERVIILINGNVASSAEGFLLRAVQSRKVLLAGQHSKGELDYANVNYLDSPGHTLTLGCPTSRSRRLPASPVDNIGVQPNILLPPEKDWIGWIAQRADDFEFSPARFAKADLQSTGYHLPRQALNDTSMVDLAQMAHAIIPPDCRSTVDRVRQIVEWTNRNFEWTFTDYKARTVKQIIVRGGGNCDEQTRITRTLLSQLGIQTRSMCEINIQPDDEGRQARAEARAESPRDADSRW